ncbi:MAG: hypothetical protein WC471_04360 [Candidatus Woesearchaeota archaeon]
MGLYEFNPDGSLKKPVGWKKKDEAFFESVGYLANSKRKTQLWAEVPQKSEDAFEVKYKSKSGEDVASSDDYRKLDSVDKFGPELRITFKKSDKVPEYLKDLTEDSTAWGPVSRINSNKYWWNLIEYGFKIGKLQDSKRIKQRVPADMQAYFDAGYSLP